MRLTRSHVSLDLQLGTAVALPEDVVAHLGRVLRLGVGDSCVLFNGDGKDYHCRVESMEKRSGIVLVEAARELANESPLQITLVQSVARGEKMDWIVQKATELGVDRIIPVYSQRGEVKLQGTREEKRVNHWQEVAISACEQSGRAVIPEIDAPVGLKSLELDVPLKFCLEPTASSGFASFDLAPDAQVAIAIGPEGGWSEADLQELERLKFVGVQLGPRILRTETAGIAAISALQCVFGDFGRTT